MAQQHAHLSVRFWSLAKVGYTWATSGSPLGSRALLRASATVQCLPSPSIHSMRPTPTTGRAAGKGRANATQPRAPQVSSWTERVPVPLTCRHGGFPARGRARKMHQHHSSTTELGVGRRVVQADSWPSVAFITWPFCSCRRQDGTDRPGCENRFSV